MSGNLGAQSGEAAIQITTGQLVYAPGDKATFSISIDAAGQSLSGDLVMRVYPAASPLEGNPFSKPPLSETMVQQGISVNGAAAVGYEAAISDDLKAGTGGFPVSVGLIQDGREVLTGSTWLAVTDPGAHEPIDLVLVWTVGGPPTRDPAGVFQSTLLLERCQSNPRPPDSLIQSVELSGRFPRIKTTYAIEGLLLDELSDMSDGFELVDAQGTKSLPAGSNEAAAADNCLQGLRTLARAENSEILSAPYVFASLPVLAREGWEDGNGQYRVSRDILTGGLGLPGIPPGTYIPGLDLTTDSLRYIASTGGEYAVLAGSIRQNVVGPVKPENAAFRLRDLGGERITAMFSLDDASATLLGGAPDPNAFFAALANAFDAAAPARLVIAASPVAAPQLSAEQRERVYAELERQTWISSITLGEAKAKYRPDTEPVTLQRYIEPLSGYVAESYFRKLSQVHELFEAYRVAVDTDEPELLRLVKNMYTAESEYFLSEIADPDRANLGLAYQEAVAGFVQQELARLKVSVDTPWLQRAGGGEATIVIVNDNPYPFNMELAFAGEGIEFPEGTSQKMRLETGRTEVKVPYYTDGWSRFSARIESRGLVIAEDGSGIRPVTTRVWIVLIVAILATAGASAYLLLVVRRR